MRENIVVTKSFTFAIQTVNCYKKLCSEQKEYVLSKQLLRAGTSIGANIREGVQAQSKKDFVSKMSIALKEAYETEYWIELLTETDYLTQDDSKKLLHDLSQITKILSSIIMTSKKSLNN